MVTLKCWGSEINSFLLSSFKPTPVGPAQTQTHCEYERSHRIHDYISPFTKRDRLPF
uniref:Uncharacterized protein n=1 Tax=Sander lucioperca TaxID=283035 RepID=A0A8D0DCY0_SANLU